MRVSAYRVSVHFIPTRFLLPRDVMMVGQVYATLAGIFTEHGKLLPEEAIALLQEMEHSQRLLVDCWGTTLHYERTMEHLEVKYAAMALNWLKKTFTKLKEQK